MKSILALFFVFFISGCTPAASVRPDNAADDVELVQSIPEGTGLEQPDLRFARDVWVEMIDRAHVTLDLAEFYAALGTDGSLNRVYDALERAGVRGVKTRFLFQDSMMSQDPEAYAKLRTVPGLTLLPIHYKAFGGGILHAKYFVVDGVEAYVGSQNFDWRSLTQIHELGARVRDAAVATKLEHIFEIDWRFAGTGARPEATATQVPAENPATPAPTATQLVASPPALNPPDVASALPALLDLLSSARKSIHIQLLDYNSKNWDAIDSVLRSAAARGIQVELLVSHWNLSKPAVGTIQALARVPGIEVRIATIPPLTPCVPFSRVNHSKYLVVDGETLWVGTSNWSKGYFTDSRNVELIFHRPALAATGERIFAKLWNSTYTAPLDPARDYPKPVRDCGQGK
jgi:phosphatidylserine/phosphatidylglycerophosphate/cardiolipin synthase-like enzyme